MTAAPLISGITGCYGLGEEGTLFCPSPSRLSLSCLGRMCLVAFRELSDGYLGDSLVSLSVILNGANGHLRFRFCYLPPGAFLVQENQQPSSCSPPTSDIHQSPEHWRQWLLSTMAQIKSSKCLLTIPAAEDTNKRLQ